jgi:hypothetical protein
MQTFLLDLQKLQHGVSGSLKSMNFPRFSISDVDPKLWLNQSALYLRCIVMLLYKTTLYTRKWKERDSGWSLSFPLDLTKIVYIHWNDKISALWKGVSFPLTFISLSHNNKRKHRHRVRVQKETFSSSDAHVRGSSKGNLTSDSFATIIDLPQRSSPSCSRPHPRSRPRSTHGRLPPHPPIPHRHPESGAVLAVARGSVQRHRTKRGHHHPRSVSFLPSPVWAVSRARRFRDRNREHQSPPVLIADVDAAQHVDLKARRSPSTARFSFFCLLLFWFCFQERIVYTEGSSFPVSHCVLLLFLSAPRTLGSSHSVSTLVWVQWS